MCMYICICDGRWALCVFVSPPPPPPPPLQLADTLFPTHVGHYLGMETHDTQSVSFSLQLLPGMVVTVEPGVYLPTDLTSHLLGPKAEQ